MYAVKRYAFRLGHAARSARFATSVEQLVVGLAPVMGWGVVPRGGVERARFVRAHRRSVQRWLDDLQFVGIVAHEPEKDCDGLWWRTQLVLLTAPEPTDLELQVARLRARGWPARDQARRRRARTAPSLGSIRERSGVPTAATCAAAARRRVSDARTARRRAAVDALLTHPFGAPPSSADESLSPRRPSRDEVALEGSAATCSVRTDEEHGAVVALTGARATRASGAWRAQTDNGDCAEEVRRLSREDFDALVARLLTVRAAPPWRASLRRTQASARVAEVLRWPAGRVCPLGRLREAWAAQRYGLARVGERGAADAGPVRPDLVGRAIRLYEAHEDDRPPGWPRSGAAALCMLAAQRRAGSLAGDVATLLALAKGMRAVALEHDHGRLARARIRAVARRRPTPSPFTFRLAAARVETAERRRQRIRDAVLLSGGDPAAWPNAALASRWLFRREPAPRLVDQDRLEELDGYGARAARYRAQLAGGAWRLPDVTTNPTEGAPR